MVHINRLDYHKRTNMSLRIRELKYCSVKCINTLFSVLTLCHWGSAVGCLRQKWLRICTGKEVVKEHRVHCTLCLLCCCMCFLRLVSVWKKNYEVQIIIWCPICSRFLYCSHFLSYTDISTQNKRSETTSQSLHLEAFPTQWTQHPVWTRYPVLIFTLVVPLLLIDFTC